ncbi:hypothetical protein OS189_09220 [Sulfitobacter sp. F26169L]|uniref:hypothetical protein n=1 Tax=Sulfitobacter sp. F26169L TaxID=2996015 RepID=UPI0022608BD6|nr:hypothetical protein [Sulfitobacter sp. F26169L]MCX7566518.1 hypothetical protein [Sulfitobacter sp. F26169L]
MKTFLTITSLTALLLATSAHAAPIGAFSELVMTHSYIVNNGNKPDGIDIASVPGALVIENGATSAVDDPSAVETDIGSAQVGNIYSAPPLPSIRTRIHSNQLPGGFEGASSGYDLELLYEPDPNVEFSGVTRTTSSREGAASAILLDDTIAASAASFARNSRTYSFTNTTNALISFNIAGSFDAYLRSEYNGDNGIARAAGGIDLLFSELAGAQINYFPVSPYLTTSDDDDIGASIIENLFANSGLTTGLRFNASTTAIGSGGTTSSIFEGEHSYVFQVNLDPGAHVWMTSAFGQANSVEHTPQPAIPPVPLPASAILLVLGLASLLGLRRSPSA